MKATWSDWLDRHRVVVISALNSMLVVTLAVLVGAAASDNHVQLAWAAGRPEVEESPARPPRARAAPTPEAAAHPKPRPGASARPRGAVARREHATGRPAPPSAGEARPAAAHEPAGPRRSSYREASEQPRPSRPPAPEPDSSHAAPPPRGIESAADYGPWKAAQNDPAGLAPLPPGHPLSADRERR